MEVIQEGEACLNCFESTTAISKLITELTSDLHWKIFKIDESALPKKKRKELYAKGISPLSP